MDLQIEFKNATQLETPPPQLRLERRRFIYHPQPRTLTILHIRPSTKTYNVQVNTFYIKLRSWSRSQTHFPIPRPSNTPASPTTHRAPCRRPVPARCRPAGWLAPPSPGIREPSPGGLCDASPPPDGPGRRSSPDDGLRVRQGKGLDVGHGPVF